MMNEKELLEWYLAAGVDAICGDVPGCLQQKAPPRERPTAVGETASRPAITDLAQMSLKACKNAREVCEAAATLEELRYADLLVHVIDATDPQRQAHIAVVEKLIGALAGEGVPVISCYNKADLEVETLPHGELTIAVSAKTGAGLSDLLALMEQALQRGQHRAKFLLPYAMAGQLELLHRQAQVLACEYTERGIAVEAVCDEILYGKLQAYLIESEG